MPVWHGYVYWYEAWECSRFKTNIHQSLQAKAGTYGKSLTFGGD
jgi:hypothetical protein